ncbi:MAG: M56 family metallopeptidase, partial [bacterium]|nr:M56 family metallopeptidase [bacterium]
MNALLRLGETVFPHLLDAAWKATALIPIVLVLTRILGKKRPVARYWLWVYCLVGLLVLPVASFFVGEHGMLLLPASVSQAVSEHPATSSEKIVLTADTPAKKDEESEGKMLPVDFEEETGRASPGTPASPPNVRVAIENPPDNIPPPEPSNLEGAQSTTPEDVTTEASSITSSPHEPERETPSAGTPPAAQLLAARSHAPRPSSFPWRGAIGLAWMTGCAAMFVRLLFASVALARLRRSSRPVSDTALLRLFDEVKQTAGFRTSVQLRAARRVTSPVSVGIVHPMILLPESLPDEMPPDQLRPILLHELGHVRWRDHAINVVQRLLEALFFFHPFVHLLNRHLRSLREEICDAWVMSHCRSATLYARALTALAERWLARGGNPIGVGLFNHRVHLPERIKRILSLGRTLPATLRFRTALLLLAVSVLAVAGLSLVSLSSRAMNAQSEKVAGQEKTTTSAQPASEESAITWKDDAVYRDGKPYAKIVQWEPEADLPMVAFGDQNNNGRTDIWIRFLNGKPLRIEIDSNEDGRIDKWEHYFDGVIDLVEVDGDFNRKVDLWQVYDNGKLFREEIDLNADGSVDKWLEVDDKGNLVEKEIFSWVAGPEAQRLLGGRSLGTALARFHNARDRAERVEGELRAIPGSTSPAVPGPTETKPAAPGKPPERRSAYVASTGSRIEQREKAEDRELVCQWYHIAVSDKALAEELRMWLSGKLRYYDVHLPVRHAAMDRGLDGGVDTWEQIGPPIGTATHTYEASDHPPLFQVTCDDLNRDGRADRYRATFERDVASRQVARVIDQTDSDGDGLVDRHDSEWKGPPEETAARTTPVPGRVPEGDSSRRVFKTSYSQRNGAFELTQRDHSLVRTWPAGTSTLRLNLRLVAGEEPPPLLCTLSLRAGGPGPAYGRVFWLGPGETVNIPKLMGGAYDLDVSLFKTVVSASGETGQGTPKEKPGEQEVVRFTHGSFVVLPGGETVSKTLVWDAHLVFRARVISNSAEPLAGFPLSVSPLTGGTATVRVLTDAAGDFDLFNISPGLYLLSGSDASSPPRPEGPAPLEATIQIQAPTDEPPERQLIFSPFGRPQNAPRIPPDWKAPVGIFGKVLSHEGEPLSNIRIELRKQGRDER